MLPLLLPLLLVAGPAAPGPDAGPQGPWAAPAPAADSGYSASLRYTYERVAGRRNWHHRVLSVETPLPVGTLVTNLGHQRRFGRSEVTGSAHYWADLWGDAYGHLHGSLAPRARTVPRRSLGGALYQVVGDWELAGHVEWRRYAGTPVYTMGPQVARYVGNWYLRLRTAITEQGGRWSLTQSAAARYYLGGPTSFVEGRAGYGRTVEVVGLRPAAPLQNVRSYFGSARLQHYFGAHLGATVSATYGDGAYRRAGLSLGLLARW
jgi:YaiO family outer membrane protein